MTPAKALLTRMLEAASTGNVTRKQRHAFDAVARELGPEAMEAAREEAGRERDEKRVDTRRSLA